MAKDICTTKTLSNCKEEWLKKKAESIKSKKISKVIEKKNKIIVGSINENKKSDIMWLRFYVSKSQSVSFLRWKINKSPAIELLQIIDFGTKLKTEYDGYSIH